MYNVQTRAVVNIINSNSNSDRSVCIELSCVHIFDVIPHSMLSSTIRNLSAVSFKRQIIGLVKTDDLRASAGRSSVSGDVTNVFVHTHSMQWLRPSFIYVHDEPNEFATNALRLYLCEVRVKERAE